MVSCRPVQRKRGSDSTWSNAGLVTPYINATTSMPATPAIATCEELSDAAPLPRPLTPGVSEEDVEEGVAVARLDVRVTLVASLVDSLVDSLVALFVAVMVTVLLARVTVLVIVDVWVRVVVPDVVSCARARRGRRAADKMLVNCMVTNSRCDMSRMNPR